MSIEDRVLLIEGNTLSLNARDVNQLLVDVDLTPPGRGRLRCLAYLTDSATLPKYKHDTPRRWMNIGYTISM